MRILGVLGLSLAAAACGGGSGSMINAGTRAAALGVSHYEVSAGDPLAIKLIAQGGREIGVVTISKTSGSITAAESEAPYAYDRVARYENGKGVSTLHLSTTAKDPIALQSKALDGALAATLLDPGLRTTLAGAQLAFVDAPLQNKSVAPTSSEVPYFGEYPCCGFNVPSSGGNYNGCYSWSCDTNADSNQLLTWLIGINECGNWDTHQTYRWCDSNCAGQPLGSSVQGHLDTCGNEAASYGCTIGYGGGGCCPYQVDDYSCNCSSCPSCCQ
jgi:hypothetical protein